MQYTQRKMESRDPDTALYDSLGPVVRGMGLALVELSVFQGKKRGADSGNVQVRLVIYKDGSTGHEDCSRVHFAVLPRLELAFPGRDIYLEVSSPGIDRLIKDGSEFVHYIGRKVKCYRTDISGWTSGILCAADEQGIVLRAENVRGDSEKAAPEEAFQPELIPYGIIAKARLAE